MSEPCSTEFKDIKDCKKRPGKVAGIVKTEAEKCGIDINAVRTRPKLCDALFDILNGEAATRKLWVRRVHRRAN